MNGYKCHFVVLPKLVYRRSVILLVTKGLPTICFQSISEPLMLLNYMYYFTNSEQIQYNVKNLHKFYTFSKYVEYYSGKFSPG